MMQARALNQKIVIKRKHLPAPERYRNNDLVCINNNVLPRQLFSHEEK